MENADAEVLCILLVKGCGEKGLVVLDTGVRDERRTEQNEQTTGAGGQKTYASMRHERGSGENFYRLSEQYTSGKVETYGRSERLL